MIKRFRHFLIRLLGGHVDVVLQPVQVPVPRVDYRGKGRPMEITDWEKLATMNSWGEVFFRFLAWELDALDDEEGKLKLSPDHDREAVGVRVRRACLRDLQKLGDTAAARVTAYNNAIAAKEPRNKGLNNNGK